MGNVGFGSRDPGINLTTGAKSRALHKMGGHVNTAISRKTHLLVCGQKSGVKMLAAQKKGIPTISEEDFVAACAHSAMSPTPSEPLMADPKPAEAPAEQPTQAVERAAPLDAPQTTISGTPL